MQVNTTLVWLDGQRRGGDAAPPVTTPPVGRTRIRLPKADEAALLLRPTEVADTPAAIVKSTYATAPFEIAVVFIPEAKHVTAPKLAKQFSVLPAPAADGPAVTVNAVTSAGEYVTVH